MFTTSSSEGIWVVGSSRYERWDVAKWWGYDGGKGYGSSKEACLEEDGYSSGAERMWLWNNTAAWVSGTLYVVIERIRTMGCCQIIAAVNLLVRVALDVLSSAW
jgi:hypothetical protein